MLDNSKDPVFADELILSWVEEYSGHKMVYILETTKTLAGGKKVTYLYLAHNTRVGGVTVKEWMISLGKKEEALAKLKEVARSHKSLVPESAEPLPSALLGAYLDIFADLGLVDIVDQVTEKTRAQGITPGQYLLFCTLNRLIAPKSTKQLKDWFAGTILAEKYPGALPYLTPQHVWNHFQYFDEERLQEIYFRLVRAVRDSHGNPLRTLLLDSTNFYTYIADHPQNALPRKGHCKEGRKHLNLVNFCLLLDEEKEVPVYYKTYPGNVPDSQYFKDILPEISSWFHRLGTDRPAPGVTLVFDKGNNSPEALEIIEQNHWGFVGSLRPSMFKELLQEPYTEFSKIYDTKKKHAVYAFRRAAKVYTEAPSAVIVTFDEQVHNKSLHTLEYHLAKKFDLLQAFTIEKLNTKPQWKDPIKIRKHVDAQILQHKDFKEMVHVIIEGSEKAAAECQELRWGLNAPRVTEEVKTFGKSIIFSNKLEWSTEEIVRAYRQQFKVEKKFAAMKSTDYIRVRPMYHWTDHNIRVHTFICLLALLGQSLLALKLKALNIQESLPEVAGALQKVHKVNLYYGKDAGRQAVMPKLSEFQQKLVAQLHLDRYLMA